MVAPARVQVGYGRRRAVRTPRRSHAKAVHARKRWTGDVNVSKEGLDEAISDLKSDRDVYSVKNNDDPKASDCEKTLQ